MEWFNSEKYVNQPIQSISNIDFLVREIATPKSRFYRYAQNPIDEETLKLSFERFSRKEFTDFLTENLEFRSDYPGDHINWWDFEKCKLYLEEAGFSHIIESKYTGSMTPHMCGRDFDQTEPRMSCYVEAIK
jgi:hypothetical protein